MSYIGVLPRIRLRFHLSLEVRGDVSALSADVHERRGGVPETRDGFEFGLGKAAVVQHRRDGVILPLFRYLLDRHTIPPRFSST